jgi:hypothetical protein
MNTTESTYLDRALAKVCEFCPVCLHARHHQQGLGYNFVKNVENGICPFCQAYERVHGKKAHEKRV